MFGIALRREKTIGPGPDSEGPFGPNGSDRERAKATSDFNVDKVSSLHPTNMVTWNMAPKGTTISSSMNRLDLHVTMIVSGRVTISYP